VAHLHPPEHQIHRLMAFVTKSEASDLHLKVGLPPYIRVGGHLRAVDVPILPSSDYITAMMVEIMPKGREKEYKELGGIDFAVLAESGDRFRVNAYRSDGEMHAALRRVQSQIPDFEKLKLPPVYQRTISRSNDGLILVTGVTGSGKSSTLAAMMNWINQHRGMHVITIEDPIEYRFISGESIISQREIGIDVPSYAHALRFVVRQDPDLILIGELRDKETILAAIQAAETGHLVMASMHCSDAEQSFSRILEFFPQEEHAFIRSSLANSLRAIMCQRLIPGAVEGSRFPATEVLLNNPIVRDKILNSHDDDIPAILNVCRDEGMRDFTHSLCELIEAGSISMETGMDYAPSRETLSSLLKGIDTGADGLISRV